LKTNGADLTKCITYSSGCKTIDCVMREIVNKTINSRIYIDEGTYSYTMNGNDNNDNGGYSNRVFRLSGYISGGFVDADDISSYPIILFNTTNGNSGIYFNANVGCSFEYVKIYRGSGCAGGKRLVKSFIYDYFFQFID
jgi:hypothetical protein